MKRFVRDSFARGFCAYFLATPYSSYAEGHDAAFRHAAELSADIVAKGGYVFAPVVLGHPMSLYGSLDPLDHSIWLPLTTLFLKRCDEVIVAKLPGWDTSKGVEVELDLARRNGMLIHALEVYDDA